MSFGLTPREHLDILIEERNLYQKDLSSIRMGVNCCVWANHLPEIIFAAHHGTAPTKVYGQSNEKNYRDHVIILHPGLGIIRDLCDFAKHGPQLRRATVQANKTDVQTTLEVSPLIAAGIPMHDEVNRVVVTLKDTTTRWLNVLIEDAVGFWEAEFATHSL